MKQCSKCLTSKDLSCFSKQKKGKNGVRSVCKECIRLNLNITLTNEHLLSRACKCCNISLNSLTPYKKYCSTKCKQKHYRSTNKQKNYLTNKHWKQSNKEHIKSQSRKYYNQNPGKYIAKVRKRQVDKLNATFSDFNHEINHIYSSVPRGYEVHHIIPLKEFSNIVCGLHVPWNLQVISKEQHVALHRLLRIIFS